MESSRRLVFGLKHQKNAACKVHRPLLHDRRGRSHHVPPFILKCAARSHANRRTHRSPRHTGKVAGVYRVETSFFNKNPGPKVVFLRLSRSSRRLGRKVSGGTTCPRNDRVQMFRSRGSRAISARTDGQNPAQSAAGPPSRSGKALPTPLRARALDCCGRRGRRADVKERAAVGSRRTRTRVNLCERTVHPWNSRSRVP
jgi:hypothetical protein